MTKTAFILTATHRNVSCALLQSAWRRDKKWKIAEKISQDEQKPEFIKSVSRSFSAIFQKKLRKIFHAPCIWPHLKLNTKSFGGNLEGSRSFSSFFQSLSMSDLYSKSFTHRTKNSRILDASQSIILKTTSDCKIYASATH